VDSLIPTKQWTLTSCSCSCSVRNLTLDFFFFLSLALLSSLALSSSVIWMPCGTSATRLNRLANTLGAIGESGLSSTATFSLPSASVVNLRPSTCSILDNFLM